MLAPAALEEAFRAAGFAAGDLVMLHGDALALTQIDASAEAPAARAETLFQGIETVLGPGGTLVMPCFSYSATKGEVFDPNATPGTVGLLPELFRARANVRRTAHPIFSVACSGAATAAIMAAPLDDCFGAGTVFDLLYQRNGLIACLACGFDRVTFVHYVEQRLGVGYRYFKSFEARVVEGGRERHFPVRYLVRDLERATQTDLRRLKSRLEREGKLRLVPFGRAALVTVRVRDFLDEAVSLLADNPAGLIREGA
ncbi:MAG TPA: AAC(3) family N-acetyltransferase [Stellaceae bacterium]|jgi:aminoglycoside 3-N-acetyltransferase|nr:AAC(3) family N-acetyltransferase [Stellaceae bacterium]